MDKIKKSHRQVPMLLISGEDETTWTMYNIMDNKFLVPKLSVPYNKRFSGSSRGWVVAVSEDWSVTLYKPLSMVKEGDNEDTSIIHLPRLFPAPSLDVDDSDIPDDDPYYTQGYAYRVKKVSITSDPLANPGECIVMLVLDSEGVAFIRLTKDTTWTHIDNNTVGRDLGQDAIYYKSRLHISDIKGVLFSLDVANPSHPRLERATPRVPKSDDYYVKMYPVESNCGDLLQVERHFSFCASNGRRMTRKFEIFRYDSGLSGKKWIKVKSLGTSTLFLGDNSSICVNASDFVGCRPNCIYFTHDSENAACGYRKFTMVSDMGIYHVESKKVEFYFGLNKTTISKKTSRPPIWVLPTLVAYP